MEWLKDNAKWLGIIVMIIFAVGGASYTTAHLIVQKDIKYNEEKIEDVKKELEKKASKSEITYQKEKLELILDLQKDTLRRINRIERTVNNLNNK